MYDLQTLGGKKLLAAPGAVSEQKSGDDAGESASRLDDDDDDEGKPLLGGGEGYQNREGQELVVSGEETEKVRALVLRDVHCLCGSLTGLV